MASAATVELEKVLKRLAFVEKNVTNLEGWLRENFGYLRHLNFEALRLTDAHEASPAVSSLTSTLTQVSRNIINQTQAPMTSNVPKPKAVTFAEPIATTSINCDPVTTRNPWLVNPTTTSNGTIRKEAQSGKTSEQVAANKPRSNPAEKTTVDSDVASSRKVQGAIQKQVQGQPVTEGIANAGSNQSFAPSTISFADVQLRDPRLRNGNRNVQPAAVPPHKPMVTEVSTSNQLPRVQTSKPAANEAPAAQPARMLPPKPAASPHTPTLQIPHPRPPDSAPAGPRMLPPKPAVTETVPPRTIPKSAPSEAPRPNPSNMLPPKPETTEGPPRLLPQPQPSETPKLLPLKPTTAGHVSSPTPTMQPGAENIQPQSKQNWTDSAMEPDWKQTQFPGGNWNEFQPIPIPAPMPENMPGSFYNQTRQFACKKCNASFDNQNVLNLHVHKVHKKFLCKCCSKGFDTWEQLNQHNEAKHPRKKGMHSRSNNKKQKRHGQNSVRDFYQNSTADDPSRETPQDTNQAVSSTTRSPNYAGQNIPVVPIFHNNFSLQSRPPPQLLIPPSFRPQFPGGNFYRPGASMMNFNAGSQPGLQAFRPHDNMQVFQCPVCSKPFQSIQNMRAHMQNHK